MVMITITTIIVVMVVIILVITTIIPVFIKNRILGIFKQFMTRLKIYVKNRYVSTVTEIGKKIVLTQSTSTFEIRTNFK